MTSWLHGSGSPKHRTRENFHLPTITALTQKITEQVRKALLRLRAKRLNRQELCTVDPQAVQHGETALRTSTMGRTRTISLLQTLEVVVYTLDHHMPVYYRTLQEMHLIQEP